MHPGKLSFSTACESSKSHAGCGELAEKGTLEKRYLCTFHDATPKIQLVGRMR